jgi:hypothetical protein
LSMLLAFGKHVADGERQMLLLVLFYGMIIC